MATFTVRNPNSGKTQVKVKIVANHGNEYYDQFINEEFDANEKLLFPGARYYIDEIKTKTPLVKNTKDYDPRYVEPLTGTYWFASEIKRIQTKEVK